MRWRLWLGALAWSAALPAGMAAAQALKPEQIVEAKAPDRPDSRPLAAKVQILLDRARFSPGVIDGRMGENVVNALAAFRKAHQLESRDKTVDEATFARLSEIANEAAEPVLVEYVITEEDVKGPFAKAIPESLEEQGTLDHLGYTGPSELLAEKFHMDEDFLKELNPGKDFAQAGTAVVVANVASAPPPERGSVRRIELDKARKQLRALGDGDRLLAVYPATIGSAARPAPTGEHKIKGVARNPKYTYNPAYKFEGVKTDKPFTIAPGPNNPVGAVWIDLSVEGYGIHGTPEPDKIGKSASHGCVRLTNWDAAHLAEMVKPGVTVHFGS
ncbi:MAG TPA: L,D-transpeptidase family protein [Microvirga sp.]|nr:L,D-transpeptidase family protein [Microvirga sp.]